MRALLDTCVVLDYLENREPFFDDALNIMISAANREIKACVTANTVTDLFYITHQKLHDNERAREMIARLLEILGIVDTKAEDCTNALVSDISDFEDALMIESAYRAGVDYIITRDEKDYKRSKVPVLSPGGLCVILDNK